MNLREFEAWALAQKSVANPTPDFGFKGHCVSLIQQYLYNVCGIPFKARGHAKSWATNIIEGWDKLSASTALKAGDILVYTSGEYGHIVIVDADLKCLEQNKGYNGIVTVGDIRKGYSCVLRSRKAIDIGKVDSKYTVGQVYTTQVILKVREGAGTNYNQKRYNQLTVNAKANAYSSGVNIGCLKVGTRVTLLELRNVNGNIWGRIPSGWIAFTYGGKTYVK